MFIALLFISIFIVYYEIRPLIKTNMKDWITFFLSMGMIGVGLIFAVVIEYEFFELLTLAKIFTVFFQHICPQFFDFMQS